MLCKIKGNCHGEEKDSCVIIPTGASGMSTQISSFFAVYLQSRLLSRSVWNNRKRLNIGDFRILCLKSWYDYFCKNITGATKWYIFVSVAVQRKCCVEVTIFSIED